MIILVAVYDDNPKCAAASFGCTDRAAVTLCDPRSIASRSIFVAGGLLVVLGLIMIPLPGPGYLIVSLGLLVLVVGLVVSATAWLSRQSQDPGTH